MNEQYCTDGEQALLTEHLYHYPFNKGFSAWVAKHDRYSTMEAELLFSGGRDEPLRPKELFSRDPAARRREIKNLVYRMPGRPLLIFSASTSSAVACWTGELD